MNKVECIIRHERMDELKNALIGIGVGGMTITDVRGFGKETSRPEGFLILPKLKVEIYCSEEQTQEIIDVIVKTCRRNELGDGKIAVYQLANLIRIRTGERDLQAIY